MSRLAVENLRNFQMLRKREHDGFTHKRGLFAISRNKVFSGPSTEEVVYQCHASLFFICTPRHMVDLRAWVQRHFCME